MRRYRIRSEGPSFKQEVVLALVQHVLPAVVSEVGQAVRARFFPEDGPPDSPPSPK